MIFFYLKRRTDIRIHLTREEEKNQETYIVSDLKIRDGQEVLGMKETTTTVGSTKHRKKNVPEVGKPKVKDENGFEGKGKYTDYGFKLLKLSLESVKKRLRG